MGEKQSTKDHKILINENIIKSVKKNRTHRWDVANYICNELGFPQGSNQLNGQNKEFPLLSRNIEIETHFNVVFISQTKFLNTDTVGIPLVILAYKNEPFNKTIIIAVGVK